jgi:colanic acid biosynthesis glycosyl transferase WcaI
MAGTSQTADRRSAILLCQHFYPEMISTGMHMTELAVELTRRGWSMTVICAQPRLLLSERNQEVPPEIDYQGIRVIRVRAWGSHASGLLGRLAFALSYLVSSTARVIRERRSARGLLVTTNPPFLGLAGWIADRLFRLPYVLIVYDVYPDIAVRLGVIRERSVVTRLWDRITRLMMRGARVLIVIGRDMERLVRNRLPAAHQERIRLIPNWSDANAVSPVPRNENTFVTEHGLADRFVVQYSGRLGQTHNLEPLIEAAELLREEAVTFQIIGDGRKRAPLQAMVEERGLPNVQFLPYQPIERLDETLSAADLAVVCLGPEFTGLSVPSKTYGVMAAGKPVLALLDPGSEIGLTIREVGCGVVLGSPSGAEVAALIRKLMGDREQLARMGANALAAFRQEYTLERAGDRYDQCLTAAF